MNVFHDAMRNITRIIDTNIVFPTDRLLVRYMLRKYENSSLVEKAKIQDTLNRIVDRNNIIPENKETILAEATKIYNMYP